MSVPEFQCFMVPLLKLSATGEIAQKDAVEIVSVELKLSEEDKAELVGSGIKPKVYDRTAWAITYLVQAKLMKRPKRGFFTITDRGKQVLATDPDRIDKDYLMQFKEFEDFQTRTGSKSKKKEINSPSMDRSDFTPVETIEDAENEISAQIKSELLQRALDSTPAFFEKLVVNLLVGMGYGGSIEQAGMHLGKSGDNGVDGVINEDKLGLDQIYIQAKRYAPENTVGRPDIQRFAGSLMGMGTQKGVFVTTSSFSKEAVEYASNIGQRLILIDGSMLTELMLKYNVGTRLERTIEIKKVDEDFFE